MRPFSLCCMHANMWLCLPACQAYHFATCPSLQNMGVLRKPHSSKRNYMCMNGFRWVRGFTGADPFCWYPSPIQQHGGVHDGWGKFGHIEWPDEASGVRDSLSTFHSMCLLDGHWPHERSNLPFVRSFSSSCRVSSQSPYQGILVGELV